MFTSKFYVGTFYNPGNNMQLYRAVDNKLMSTGMKSHYEQPVDIKLKSGTYDVWMVAHHDEEDGGYWNGGAFIIPSGLSRPDSFELIKLYCKETYSNDIYCFTSEKFTECASSSNVPIHRDAFYSIDDIISNGFKGLVPAPIMDELLECARDSSGNFSRYENITGHKLMEWAEEKNIAPNFRLNTHFVNSSHFVEDCYMRMNSSGEPFLAIRGGIQFLAGRELSVYTFGDSCLYIARSKYPVLESIRDDLMEAFDS